MNLVTVSTQIVLGLALLLVAIAAAFPARWLPWLVAPLPQSRVGRAATCGLFLVAGLATLMGAAVPFMAFFASCVALASAAFLLLRAALAKVPAHWLLPAAMAAASVTVAIAQPLGLKVLALPKAADLPVVAAPARVVKTYDEGLWFEGIAAADDGTLYLSANRELDFSRGDYYRNAQGQVLARRPDGDERVIFKTPKGSTAGVIAVAQDGSLYLASHGASPAIWHITLDGHAEKTAELPAGSWPNGLDVGPDGKLYSPDSALGRVWRIDPATHRVEPVIDSAQLKARPFISLAPGANGLHFRGRDMYVTVSDRTTVLKYTLDASGNFGASTLVATGIPGDDFAIGHDGSLFITTHPYNTVVRTAPDGERTIVGNASQHIVGATDAVFGRGAGDRDTLYVVTDGGAFTGGPKTRGELVALQPYARK